MPNCSSQWRFFMPSAASNRCGGRVVEHAEIVGIIDDPGGIAVAELDLDVRGVW